jgi:predicted TIM-barrel fold metal-dependent hydrolase
MIDCAAQIGPYPFRQLPHPDPDVLVRVLAREGLGGAWVGWLPSPWLRDPAPGNAALFAALAPYRDVLHPAPVVRPDWPDWQRTLRELAAQGAACIRAYPMHWGLPAHDTRLRALALACGELGLPLLLTVRFEDLRQRHPLDVAADLTAAHIRALARAGDVRLVVTGAGRELLEETHWGLTPDEQRRVHWDFAWIWGPPEDHLAHLFRTVGAERFVYGTHWPLRLTQNPRANLDLLPPELRAHGITDARSLAPIRKTPT